MVLDMLDKQLIVELWKGSCRVSYATLARHFGLTINAIKKRVDKLIESGVIKGFIAALNRGLVGGGLTEKVVGWVATDGSEEEESFIQQVGAFPTVHSVWKTARKTYGVYSPIAGFQGLSELAKFLQGLAAVTSVEFDSIVPLDSPGCKAELSTQRWCHEFDFTRSDLLVLRCLSEDPRMAIAEIARRTRLTPKRVRKILKIFKETSCVLLVANWDESKGGLMSSLIRIRVDPSAITNQELVYWLFEKYPFECWDAYSVADKPAMVLQYVCAHTIHKIDEMVSVIRSASFTKDVDAIIHYRDIVFPRKTINHIEELLTNAGL